MGKRFAIVICVVAAGVMALGAAALASQTVRIHSRVTLAIDCVHHHHPGCDRELVHGRVKSSKHLCEVQRTVKYFDRDRSRGDKLVRKDRTNNRGKWRLRPHAPRGGRVYAKVVRREVRAAGTTFVCHADRTPTLDTH